MLYCNSWKKLREMIARINPVKVERVLIKLVIRSSNSRCSNKEEVHKLFIHNK
jgi:hypothetical protein